jgi:DeoR family transcriptional regulator of aga operon
MISVSQKVIVLSDSTKFGKRGLGRICGIENVDRIITDAGIPKHYVTNLEAAGIEVTIV